MAWETATGPNTPVTDQIARFRFGDDGRFILGEKKIVRCDDGRVEMPTAVIAATRVSLLDNHARPTPHHCEHIKQEGLLTNINIASVSETKYIPCGQNYSFDKYLARAGRSAGPAPFAMGAVIEYSARAGTAVWLK